MTEIVANDTNRRKAEALARKDFTYVQIWLGEKQEDDSYSYRGSRTIVVCTPFKAEASKAVEQIIRQEGLKTRPYSPNGVYPDMRHFSLYPRTYVREAKAILRDHPERVYLVSSQHSTTAVS